MNTKNGINGNAEYQLIGLTEQADAGDGIAALKAAGLYYSLGESEKAFAYCAQAAEQGIAEAQYLLGTYYDFGVVHTDAVKAVELYRLAAEKGYAPAQNNLGGCLRDGRGVEKNPEEAVKLFASAAGKGDANACLRMAVCLRDGVGIERNMKEAEKYLYSAAKLGNIRALSMLGDFYLGKGDFSDTVLDPIGAYESYKTAAEYGSDECRYKLGLCCLEGLGTEPDGEAAIKNFELAAENGYQPAIYQLGLCYFGKGAFDKAVECFDRTVNCDTPLVESMYRLGYCYLTGKGVDRDVSSAIWLLTRASKEGSADAYNLLGDCHYFGIGSRVDYTEAVKAYIEANKRGSRYAVGMLGLCCENGLGTEKNIHHAVSMYRKAALLGDMDGAAKLGICLCRNSSEQKNGMEYLKVASEHNSIAATVELARIEYKTDPSGENWVKYYKDAIYCKSRDEKDFDGISGERIQMHLTNDRNTRICAMYELALHYLENMCHGLEPDVPLKAANSEPTNAGKAHYADIMNASYAKQSLEFAKAYEYLGRAALNGHAKAVEMLENIYSTPVINSYIFTSEFREYINNAVRSCGTGDYAEDMRNNAEFAEVYNRLGEDYFNGNMLSVSKTKAVECFGIAAKLGSSGAQYSLGWCLKNGEGVAVDYGEAKKWLLVSAMDGNANACYSLGDCYDRGLGMRVRNQSEARKWYVKAANRGNIQAARILAAQKVHN